MNIKCLPQTSPVTNEHKRLDTVLWNWWKLHDGMTWKRIPQYLSFCEGKPALWNKQVSCRVIWDAMVFIWLICSVICTTTTCDIRQIAWKRSPLSQGSCYNIEVRTKWPPFQWHFQMHCLEWNCLNFDYDFTGFCSKGSNQQHSSVGSDNGLAPTRRQAIVWTNVCYFADAYMRCSASVS